jgi:hypothetical protein
MNHVGSTEIAMIASIDYCVPQVVKYIWPGQDQNECHPQEASGHGLGSFLTIASGGSVASLKTLELGRGCALAESHSELPVFVEKFGATSDRLIDTKPAPTSDESTTHRNGRGL